MDLYFFGVTHGHLNDRAAEIAERHGAELVCYEEGGHDGYSIRRWCTFACPNRGYPDDQEIEAKVKADIEREGGIEALKKAFIVGQEINEDWTEADEEELQASKVRDVFASVINSIKSWNAESASYLAHRLNEAEELVSRAEMHGWDWLDELQQELRLALSDRGTQDDQSWPPPWDDEPCEFAFVVDKRGQYLTRNDYGEWGAVEWEDGVTCRFDDSVAAEDHEPE